ncbi:hypothetical protein ACLQ2R_29495 [Streptosporangium sp. DT93]|uniref:hypothetical protein n=1 Tax=Streptosporangium sp. DT93 TaxID=3393428 RepID=UPI003CEAE84A
MRTGSGGPGVPGASWPRQNVSFPALSGANRALRLKAGSGGTAAGTRQSEVLHRRKFLEGTYAARVKFSDAPVSGPDGDRSASTTWIDTVPTP